MSQRKLLLADDSITIQKVVNLTFADEGIEVITVGDGDSAMAKLAEISPDLVMADVHMPGLNGYQICERIRQSDALRQTPVILLVGSFEPFDETEAQRVGANDYLTKPFQSIRQLVTKVTDLLENGGAQNGENASPAAVSETVSTDLENARTLDNFEVPEEYFPVSGAESSSFSAGNTQFSPAGRGDSYAEMDDEMIDASPASSFVLDESMKFESREVNEAEEQGAAKTQPLSAEDLQQFSFTRQPEEGETIVSAQAEANSKAFGIQASDENAAAVAYQGEASVREEEQMAKPPAAPILFEADDDDDLLEIPFDEDEEEWDEPETEAIPTASETLARAADATEQAPDTLVSGNEQATPFASGETIETAAVDGQDLISQQTSAQNEDWETTEAEPSRAATESFEQNQSSENFSAPPNVIGASAQLSPEMIDAIAQRVVEKLSDRAVKDVAWEVVPQMADLIIKKMTEEKLKQ